jgi:DNA-binding NarL/FixJ family response regulator
MKKKIRLLLIEDNRLLREGLTVMLKKQKDMNVVENVGNGENIMTIMRKNKPEVLLLDLGLRNRSSLNLVKLVKKKFPLSKVIIMDLIPLQADVFEYVKGSQVLPSNLTGSLFSQIVEHAINASKPSALLDSVRMTKREKQVIELISEGHTNKEIAQELHLSTHTVKSHVHNILEKLALNTRVQIAKYAHDRRKTKSAFDDISLLDD